MSFFTKITSSIQNFVPTINNFIKGIKASGKTIGRKVKASDPQMASTILRQRKKRVIKTKVKKIRFNYSIQMIPELQNAHQDILRQASLLDNAAYEKNVNSSFEGLQALIDMLDAKISLEKSKIYPYLQKTLVNNIDDYTTMRDFRKKTDTLLQAVDALEAKYSNLKQDKRLISDLEEDITKFNGMLVNHIRDIETHLYPLYQPGA